MCNAKFDWETMKDHPGYREGPLMGNERLPVTFDMSQCKNGDRLRTRYGITAIYIGKVPIPRTDHEHVVQIGNTTPTGHNNDGTYFSEQGESNLDIIGFASPIPKIVKCEAWVNYYKTWVSRGFKSEEAADAGALKFLDTRLYCKKVEWQYEDNNN